MGRREKSGKHADGGKSGARAARAFCAEDYFDSRIPGGSMRSHATVLDFGAPPRIIGDGADRSVRGRVDNAEGRVLRYDDAVRLNAMHSEYIRRIKGPLRPDDFNAVLLRAELTGARVRVAGRAGYVVEERRNSLVVVYPGDRVRIHPKATTDFVVAVDGVDYRFIGRALKKSRMGR